MLQRLDRVRFHVSDLGLASSAYQTLLGRVPVESSPEGVVFRLDNTALELRRREDGQDRFQLCFASEDLAEVQRRLSERPVLRLGAFPDAHSGELSITGPETGGVSISITERTPEAVSRVVDGAAGAIEALDHLVVRTRDADACRSFYENGLGLRVALDRSFEDWGVRLIFCRVGGLTVELAAALGGGDQKSPNPLRSSGHQEPATRDSVYGFSWRTGNIEAAHDRLDQTGVEVSAVRKGRRPGTRVFTVRTGTCEVPTLVLAVEGKGSFGANSEEV